MAYRGKAGVHQSPVVSARHIGFGLASARQASSSSGCCRPHGQPRRSPREKERKKKREKERESMATLGRVQPGERVDLSKHSIETN